MNSTATPVLPATLTLGAVHLTVSDLDRSVAWYQTSLGLRIHSHEATTASLGDGATAVLVLHEDPLARPAGRHAGLYHYALLYPSREELARAAVRLSVTGTPIDGASDHRTHEAIYLPDPDGNGIELAADRPRDQWPADLGYAGGPAALDFAALLATIAGEDAAPHVGPGLRMGHLHLHVGDIEEGLRFYRDRLGFEVQANLGYRGLRLGRWLPPPPRLQHLARPGRRPGARAHRRPAPLDGAVAGGGARPSCAPG